jgi:hypothetical protein
MRNKTVHENQDAIKDRRDFIRASKEAEIDLMNLVEASRKPPKKKEEGVGVFWMIFFGMATMLLASVFLVPWK